MSTTNARPFVDCEVAALSVVMTDALTIRDTEAISAGVRAVYAAIVAEIGEELTRRSTEWFDVRASFAGTAELEPDDDDES